MNCQYQRSLLAAFKIPIYDILRFGVQNSMLVSTDCARIGKKPRSLARWECHALLSARSKWMGFDFVDPHVLLQRVFIDFHAFM
eukprot:901718-Pleurochrysis_carterae.AAC.3